MTSTLYHYCPTLSLVGMVTTGKLHLGNVFFMNDSMEIEWFKSICRSVVEAMRDEPEMSKSGRPHYFRSLASWLSVPSFDHVYCGCFSEVADDLSQWRGYADDGRGVSVGIDIDAVLSANEHGPGLSGTPVNYDANEAREFGESVIRQYAERVAEFRDYLGASGFAQATLRASAAKYKNPCFVAEREVRIIAKTTTTGQGLDNCIYSAVLTERLPSQIQFKDRNGRPVPYVTLDLPLDAIVEVWLGPRFGSTMDECALRLLLTKHGVDVPLRRSAASYCG